jgi:hypothetical protein
MYVTSQERAALSLSEEASKKEQEASKRES